LKFKLWVYFLLFAGLLMAILWLLQVFFLNSYYQSMKIRETSNVATLIENLYKAGDRTEIRAQITDIYRRNDMYIEIKTESGLPIFIPNINIGNGDSSADEGKTDAKSGESAEPVPDGNAKTNAGLSENTKASDSAGTGDGGTDSRASSTPNDAAGENTATTPHLPPSDYQAEIEKLTQELIAGEELSISKRVTDPETGLITLEYAAYLSSNDEDRNILFIFSPLYPLQSTIEIFSGQLTYITIISMIIAFLLSFYLSGRITQPLSAITESAAKLGKGEYGIVFEGGQYSEIIRLADTLSYTSLELAKADNMQKDIIANVSHDLRTPLTMVISYAEMIRDLSGEDPKKRTEHLQVIIDEADRLNKLVSELLEISRMQSGKQELKLSEFSLKATIENLLQSYTGYVEQEGYKLAFISHGSGVIQADEDRLKQVIANLVSNAFKYSGRDKTVEVKMFDQGTHVRCEVSDHGIGIPKRDLRHIWERYYKSSTNYQRSDSTGLGLSIVKEILLLHGAVFGVESALKKGSTFWFEIKKPESEPEDAGGTKSDAASGADAQSPTAHIPPEDDGRKERRHAEKEDGVRLPGMRL
jgi:signal transduction histidine kinase